MSDIIYGMGNCPLEIKKPEFKYSYCDPASTMDIEFGIGEDGHKTECESYIDIDAGNGAYGLHVAVKINNEWQVVEADAIRVKIRGSFERGGFKYALQTVGLMTVPFYGTIKHYSEE